MALSLPAHYNALTKNPYDASLYLGVAEPTDSDYKVEQGIPLAGYLQASEYLPEPSGLQTDLQHDLGRTVARQQQLSQPTEDKLYFELAAAESDAGAPIPKEELARRATYMEVLRAKVPQVDAMTAYQLAVADVSLEEAVAQSRASVENQPKSFFSKITSPIGGALKSVFIDAPNWLWKHTTVDLMQEIAELGGIDPNVAQKLSPGQAIVGLLPGNLGTQDETTGKWLNPEEWSGSARWASGGLDIVMALAADPTNVLMNFRAFRSLPLGVERAFGITRGTRGGLIPTPLLKGREGLITFDPERIARISSDLLQSQNVFRNFVAGHVKLTELTSFVRGHKPFADAAQWVAEVSEDNILNGMAKIARRWHGKLDRRNIATLATLGNVGGRQAVEDGIIAMLGGGISDDLAKLIDVHAERYLGLKAEVVRASNQAQLMEKNRSGYGRLFGVKDDIPGNPEYARDPYIVDPIRNLSLEPSMNMPFSAKYMVAQDPSLASALELRVPQPLPPHVRTDKLGEATYNSLGQDVPVEIISRGEGGMVTIRFRGGPTAQVLESQLDNVAMNPRPRPDEDLVMREIEEGIPLGDRPGALDVRQQRETTPGVLEELELGAAGPRDPLMPMPPEPGIHGVEAQLYADELDIPAEYAQTVRGGLGAELAAERKVIENLGEMFPNLKELLHGVSTEAEARALIDVARQTSPIGLLDHIPRSLMGVTDAKFYDKLPKGARAVASWTSRNMDFQAKPDVSFHDQMSHEQIRRMAVDFGMDTDKQDEWLARWFAASKNEKQARQVAKEFRNEGFQQLFAKHKRLQGLDPDEILRRLEGAVLAAKKDELYSAAKGVNGKRILYESQYENMIELTDPRLIRTLQKSLPRFLATTPNPTARQLGTHFGSVLDGLNTFMKRMWVAKPATGLRIALENQTRALMSGMYSAWSSPHTWGAILLSPYSKKAAASLEGRAKHLANIAIDSGDLGMQRSLRYAGLMREQEVTGAFEVYEWEKLKGNRAMARWFREAHAGRINDFILNDRLAQRVLSGGRIRGPGGAPRGARADALDWLLSPEASEYRKRMRINTIEQANSRVREVMADMRDMNLFDPRLSQIARSGQVTAGDIAEFGLEAPRLPSGDIHIQPPMTNKKLLDKIVSRFLARPEEIGRRYVARTEILRNISVDMARVGPEKVDGAFLQQLIAGARPVRKGHELEYALYENAYGKAVEKVRLLFFDLADNSRFADMARFIAPFGNAWQEMTTRWSRIVADRPWIPHIAARAFDASSAVPGLTTTDPATGETMFIIPFANHLLNFAGLQRFNPITGEREGVGIPLWGRLNSVNMVTGNNGLPGFGPFLQMPASVIAEHIPQLDDMWRLLFPYGEQIHFSDVLPAWMKSLSAAVSDPDSNMRFGNMVKDYLGAEMAAAIARGESLESVDMDKITNAARITFAIRAFSQFVAPAATTAKTPYHDEAEFYRWARNIDEDLADQMFIARYGTSIFAAIAQKTRTDNTGALPPTDKMDEFIRLPEHREFFNQFGKVGLDLLAEQWEGDFDPVAFHRQINSGDRSPIQMDMFRQGAAASVAWKRWTMVSSSINRAMRQNGIAPRTKAAQPFEQIKTQIRTQLGLAFPSWAREYNETRGGLTRRAESITQLAKMATVPDLQPLESVQFIKKYFALRSATIDIMESHGISSLESQKGMGIGSWFDNQVLTLLRTHPSGARIYGKYLARDQLEPLAELIFASGLAGQFQAGIPLQGAA